MQDEPKRLSAAQNGTHALSTLGERSVVSVREAANILDVNVKTLYAEIQAGHFPAIRLGRALRITRGVLVSMLDRGFISPVGPAGARKRLP
jgi:excisionase family DNA binding protein